jgi:hypothetical protein
MQICVRSDLNAGSNLLIQHMLELKLDAVARVAAMALASCKEPSSLLRVFTHTGQTTRDSLN